MAWPIPKFTKTQVNKAGKILAGNKVFDDDLLWAIDVVDNWRSCHGYPINTFQATLRHKLKNVDSNAIVAQRLKRMFSIVGKLRRFDNMRLARMQDIGGLRAVVSSITKVRILENDYRTSKFNHDLIASYDYINNPKSSGYRGVHLVYRYKNHRVPEYDGLLLELQIRTELQHAWATAVETMGTFLNHALKSSEGPEIWLNFFSLTGSAFAHLEKTPPVPGFEELTANENFVIVSNKIKKLQVKDRLQAFSIAAKRIHVDRKPGSYHIVVLNTKEKTVEVKSYSSANLSKAGQDYTDIEKRIADGASLQAVLVSAGNIENLRRAYPNYFLDTHKFIQQISRIEKMQKNR
jgi:hypothetical protein